MAAEEPLLSDPPTKEVARHVEDYSRFTRMIAVSALVCLVIAFTVVIFVL